MNSSERASAVGADHLHSETDCMSDGHEREMTARGPPIYEKHATAHDETTASRHRIDDVVMARSLL